MTQMSSRYRTRRHAAIRAGTWDAWADPGEARKHLARMLATGATRQEIAEATGVGRMTLWTIETTDNRMLSLTSAAILAVDPASLDPAWPAAGGTRLRLRALAAVGWSIPQVAAAACGVSVAQLTGVRSGRIASVSRETLRATAAVYDELWDQIPRPSRGASRARACARDGRWLMPADLDDDLIDVPGYAPRRRSARTGAPAGEKDSAARRQESATEETAA
jgi:transcriptional regulator with XRE-family HTH domain